MKKGHIRYGFLAATSVAGLALLLTLALIRPAAAQGSIQSRIGVMVDPIILTDEVQSYHVMAVCWSSRSSAPSPVKTTIEMTFTGMGPAGPYEVVQRRLVDLNDNLGSLGGMVQNISLERREHGWDGYYKGNLVASFDGLPPGEPVIGTRVRAWTIWDNPGPGAVVGGSSQAITTDGKTSSWGKSHELSGNVTLMR
jgi:hypothetical protein